MIFIRWIICLRKPESSAERKPSSPHLRQKTFSQIRTLLRRIPAFFLFQAGNKSQKNYGCGGRFRSEVDGSVHEPALDDQSLATQNVGIKHALLMFRQ